MRVTVTRSGGVAGIVRRARLDSAGHPELAAILDELGPGTAPAAGERPAGGAPATRAADAGTPRRGADRFVYDIEIGDRALRVGEADLNGPLRRLVDHVLAHGHGQ